MVLLVLSKMLLFIIISKFQSCYLILLTSYRWLSNSFQIKAKVFTVACTVFSWSDILLPLCAHIRVLTTKLPPYCTNTGLPAVHQTPGVSFLRAFILAFFST